MLTMSDIVLDESDFNRLTLDLPTLHPSEEKTRQDHGSPTRPGGKAYNVCSEEKKARYSHVMLLAGEDGTYRVSVGHDQHDASLGTQRTPRKVSFNPPYHL
ncbi:uncharacterized protein N7459_006651 [Penicillium hispanicum]|uniref:uncharacterized protein n=1 Tax=Penicillium hispanicum TaxID=1080232 RepID=UPI00253FAE04|nr:uncharacterized protein N7459_006651 [Penicillium hispanicum]KAJ5577687.1 hypothetical protein N7459_006651 [Penicillium hispanicum]